MQHTPILATPEQLAAEATLRRFLADPQVEAVLRAQEARLAGHPIAQTPDGAARLAHAIHAWTAGLALGWAGADPENPAILLSVDNTPRTWLGQEVPALGAAGDNPDHVYRGATIDGRGRYEIRGRIDLDNRPSQLVFEVVRGSPGVITLSSASSATKTVNQSSILSDRDIQLGPDGDFVLTVDEREAAGANHLRTFPEPLKIIIRDVLSDWRQAPSRLSIHRLDKPPGAPMSYEALKEGVLARLPAYLDFWIGFPNIWMGGVPANGFKPPVQRDGGFGYQAGIRYRLTGDEVMVVTLKRGRAAYLGVQIADPYFLAPDARAHISSLNTAQARPNADGSYTYVVAAEDPGVANWLDTAGLHEGLGVLRWQAVPPGEPVADYLLEARTMDRAAFERAYAQLPRVSAAERAAQIAERAAQYALRFQQ